MRFWKVMGVLCSVESHLSLLYEIFSKIYIILKFYLFLVVLDPCYCSGFLVHRLLIAMASLVSTGSRRAGFSNCSSLARFTGSVVAAPGV